MFQRDALFGRKPDATPRDAKPAPVQVNVTPALSPAPRAAPEPVRAADRPATEASTVAAAEDGKGSKLIVGPDIKLKGVEITDCDTLVVEGRVEASMDSRVIRIAESGVFSGTVGIDVAEIRGRFEGELTARKQLIVRATGRVSGTIRYGRITIEDGGEVSGDVSTIAAAGNSRLTGRTAAAGAG